MTTHPPPTGATEVWALADGTRVTVRPVTPQDEMLLLDFAVNLSRDTRQRWFRAAIKGASASLLTRPGQMDWRRHGALIVTAFDRGVERIVADARFVISGTESAEFALVVADRWQGRGIGKRALVALGVAAQRRGLRWLRGDVPEDDPVMLQLMGQCGFRRRPHPDEDGLARMEKPLAPLGRPGERDDNDIKPNWLAALWSRSADAASVNLEQLSVDLITLLNSPPKRSMPV
jgi:acetyltransferase